MTVSQETGDDANSGSEAVLETSDSDPDGPSVAEGEVREMAIKSLGEQGDGIAKVDQGYVVIVPDAHPGDKPTIRIDRTQDTTAFASVVNQADRTL